MSFYRLDYDNLEEEVDPDEDLEDDADENLDLDDDDPLDEDGM